MICAKARYPSEAAAWLAVDEASAKRHRGKTEASVYRCRRCRGWHVTAQAPRWARRRSA